MRNLNRLTSNISYSLDITDAPEHILKTLKDTDELQSIVLSKGCVCENARSAIVRAEELYADYLSISDSSSTTPKK